MEKNPSSAEDLKTIRKIMEESTRFLSLSGFSGILIGLVAIAGAAISYFFILDSGRLSYEYYINNPVGEEFGNIRWQLIFVAVSVLILSLSVALLFSKRNAGRTGSGLWTPVSKRLMISLLVPLVSGGLFVLILLMHGHSGLIIPSLLIFYGLALANSGKFTYSEIFYLGLLEIITGLISGFFPSQGLIFWIIGFGILNITYGIIMYRKYRL